MNTDMTIRIQNITFKHYKALEDYSVGLEHVNILTGSNNSGKSTVLGSLRVLAVALRTARKSKPERISLGDSHCIGYRVKESQVPISLENVATNYVDGTSKITFELCNGNSLHLFFDREAGCVLVPESQNGGIRTTGDFKSQFPINLTVIPVLGPVEHRESLREVETVTTSLSTHRASRHFRNYWYHFPDGFDEFAELIGSTWPGMRIQRPEINGGNELNMFVAEDRIDRELYWVGFGFQIWCQLLTHLHRADPSTMIVIDEPEVYLHPEIQRKLLRVLKDTGADILVATHSIEIIAEAEPMEVLVIDKRKTKALRLAHAITGKLQSEKARSRLRAADPPDDPPESSSESVARSSEPGLAKIAKLGIGTIHAEATGLTAYLDRMNGYGVQSGMAAAIADALEPSNTADDVATSPEKRTWASFNELQFDLSAANSALESLGFVLADENDLGLVKRMERALANASPGLRAPASAAEATSPKLDSFFNPPGAGENSSSEDALPAKIIYGLRSLESCLLVPALLDRAIKAKLSLVRGNDWKSKTSPFSTLGMLMQITHPRRQYSEKKFSERLQLHFPLIEQSTTKRKQQALQEFARLWTIPAERMKLVDGKSVLQIFRSQIHFNLGVEISANDIVDAMEADEVPGEIKDLIWESKFNQVQRLKAKPKPKVLNAGVVEEGSVSRLGTNAGAGRGAKSFGLANFKRQNPPLSEPFPEGLHELLDSEQLGWEPEHDQGILKGDAAARSESVALDQTVSRHVPVDTSQEWDSASVELPELAEPLFRSMVPHVLPKTRMQATVDPGSGLPSPLSPQASLPPRGNPVWNDRSGITSTNPFFGAIESDPLLDDFPSSAEYLIEDLLRQAVGLGIPVEDGRGEGNGIIWVLLKEKPSPRTRRLIWRMLMTGFKFQPGRGYWK